MAADAPENPYLGPRPFEREDERRFFGRAREIRDVVSLVVAQRVVLLYAASGAGKSSLIQAGVLPLLESEKGFDAIPVARIRSEQTPSEANVFVAGLLASLGADQGVSHLADHLDKQPRRPGTHLRGLVVDQFEELFTAYPERWQDRPSFFAELGDALERDPGLRIVLAIREDFVAQLDPFVALLPGGLRTRFRLERLDRASALAAIEKPLDGTGRSFVGGAAGLLVDDLLRIRIDAGTTGRPVLGAYVEPVQLQVACRSLWADLPATVTEITPPQLRTYADVDQILIRFYNDAVATAARGSRRQERRIRTWVDHALITPGGTRATAYAGTAETAGLPTPVVSILEDKRLIRAEWRANARWYELTHDRLIEAIQTSNRHFASRISRQRTRLAGLIAIGVGGVAALISLLFALASPGSETSNPPGPRAPCQTCRASIRIVRVEHTSYDATISYLLSLHGQGRFTEKWALLDGLGRTVSQGSDFEFTVKAPGRRFRFGMTVKLPRRTGTFTVQFRIYPPGALVGGQPLAASATRPFKVTAPANTSPISVSLSVALTGNGSGRVSGSGLDCSSLCAAFRPYGTRVTLTALPDPTSIFEGWNGSCGRSPICSFRVGPVTQIIARFQIRPAIVG